MIDAFGTPIRVRLRGASSDPSVECGAVVELKDEGLHFTIDGATETVYDVALASVTGVSLRDGALTIYLRDHVALVLSDADELLDLRHRIEAVICTFPAATLSLRHYGSEHSAPGSDHDMWFEALMAARRVAEGSRTMENHRRVFDTARLARHAQTTREAWAQARGRTAADRRAVLAELEELCAPFDASLNALEVVTLRLRNAPDSRQFDTWRRWSAVVREVFKAADGVWETVIPVLSDSRGAQGALWRRVLRQTNGGGQA